MTNVAKPGLDICEYPRKRIKAKLVAEGSFGFSRESSQRKAVPTCSKLCGEGGEGEHWDG